MRGFLLLTALMGAARAATVGVPLATAVGTNGPDTPTQGPPDLLTNLPTAVPANVTFAAVNVTSAPVDVTSAPVNVTSANNVTSAPDFNVTSATVTSGSTEAPMGMNTTALPCQPSLVQIQGLFNYSNTAEFGQLSENQQILVYELLAAGEACRLKDFITPETAQRIFLLAEDLPLKNVYLLISFMARNMEAEGVVVPV